MKCVKKIPWVHSGLIVYADMRLWARLRFGLGVGVGFSVGIGVLAWLLSHICERARLYSNCFTRFSFVLFCFIFLNLLFPPICLCTCRFDANKSTKGASKMRRDLINAEIANLRDLLPLPQSTRQRLSQLQLMALVCVYVRKANYFQQGEWNFGGTQ